MAISCSRSIQWQTSSLWHPSVNFVPINRQLTTPFTSRSFAITGSCEKSSISMIVVALASGLFGRTLVSLQAGCRNLLGYARSD